MPANVALNQKFDRKLLVWAMGDLPGDYLNAVDANAANTALEAFAPNLIAVETSDVSISFDGQTVEYKPDGISWGAAKTAYTTDEVSITGKIALAGSGQAGTPPAYSNLFKMAGFAEIIDLQTNTVTYTPVTDNLETGVVGFMMDKQFHIGHKATIEFKASMNAGEIAYFDITIKMVGGSIPVPVPAALVSSIAGYQPPKSINFNNTELFEIDGQKFGCKSFEHTTGNEQTTLDLIQHQSSLITDRLPTITTTIGAPDIATYNAWQKAYDQTPVPIIIQHEAAAGRAITLQYYACSLSLPNYSEIDGALGIDISANVLVDQSSQKTFDIIFS